MQDKIKVNVNSEVGELEAVIIHPPGQEVQNMIPENVERALYSDILNLSVASREYKQFENVLRKITKVFNIEELLIDILKKPTIKEELISKIILYDNVTEIHERLSALSESELARQLIEGVDMVKDVLTKFLNKERFSLKPLHNFFFTRDASSAIGSKVLISKMAKKVRMRETIIMEAIFNHHHFFETETINPMSSFKDNSELSIEGGDIIIAREDIIIIGLGSRTNSLGIDYLIEQAKAKKSSCNILVQELPSSPESFIHLDMTFTLIDVDKCMVYKPLILDTNPYQTIHIEIVQGKVKSIRNVSNLIESLKTLNMNLKPLVCGGENEIYMQEREQWHSAANFFAIAPGKIIGYRRNQYTIEELNKNGFEVIQADEVIDNKINLNDYEKYVITIEGSELARGGGGARCMTMPLARKELAI